MPDNTTTVKFHDCTYLIDHTNKEIYIERPYEEFEDGRKVIKKKFNLTGGSYKVFMEQLKASDDDLKIEAFKATPAYINPTTPVQPKPPTPTVHPAPLPQPAPTPKK